MPIYVHTVLAFISCLGFGILFNVQKRTLLLAAVNGAIGWTILLSLDIPQVSYIFANLFAALVVGLLAELFAIIQKTPATACTAQCCSLYGEIWIRALPKAFIHVLWRLR